VIRDFAGTGGVSEANFAFGDPTRVLLLSPSRAADAGGSCSSACRAWDAALHCAAEVYAHRTYSLCADNCHSFVAFFLNLISYGGSKRWSMLSLVRALPTAHGRAACASPTK